MSYDRGTADAVKGGPADTSKMPASVADTYNKGFRDQQERMKQQQT